MRASLANCEYSAALCRGLIEASEQSPDAAYAAADETPYSAALCRGLIEAFDPGRGGCPGLMGRIPRLYAAASLKQHSFLIVVNTRIPRLYAAASLHEHPYRHRIPRLYAAASLKLRSPLGQLLARRRCERIPRLYAAASLKPVTAGSTYAHRLTRRIPRLYAAASLKRARRQGGTCHRR